MTSERARELLEPSVPAGESLSHHAVGVVPMSIVRMMGALFLPSTVLVIVVAAAHVNMKSPVVAVGVVAAIAMLVVLGYVGFLLRNQSIAGLTEKRLLVAELGDRAGTRVQNVRDYPLDKLGPAKRKTLHVGAAGTMAAFRLELADPPLRLDFLPDLMPDNVEQSRPICDAVTAAAQSSSGRST